MRHGGLAEFHGCCSLRCNCLCPEKHFLSPMTSLPVCLGPVTNAIIMPAPANMFLPDSRPAVPLPRFSRHLHASESDSGESGEVCVRLRLHTQVSEQVKPCPQDSTAFLCKCLSFFTSMRNFVCSRAKI